MFGHYLYSFWNRIGDLFHEFLSAFGIDSNKTSADIIFNDLTTDYTSVATFIRSIFSQFWQLISGIF